MAEQFRFEGFEPTHSLQAFAKEMMWKVESGSPSRSAQTGTLTKKDGQYSGTIKVSSDSGVFLAESEGADPKAVLQELYEGISSKLDDWKKTRFEDED